MTVINVGIVGPGRVGHRFANALSKMENAQLWSVCGRDNEGVSDFVAQHKAQSPQPAYTDYASFLKDPALDLLVIATPDNLHTEFAISAMQAKKSILIEKPLCTNLKDAQSLAYTQSLSSVKSAVGYHLRWHRGLRALKRLLDDTPVGDVFHLNMSWMHTFIEQAKWRKTASQSKWWCLTTLGTHCIDIVRWYLVPLCGEVVKIALVTSNLKFSSNDETVILSMQFESGATANITCSILCDSPFHFEIYTSKGLIKGEDLTGDSDKRRINFFGQNIPFKCDNDLYQDELNNLIHAIKTNITPEVSLEEGIKNVGCMLGEVPNEATLTN